MLMYTPPANTKLPKISLPKLPSPFPPATPMPLPPFNSTDLLNLTRKPFELMTRPEQQQAVSDAFDRRDKADAQIRAISMGTGGIGLERLEALYKAKARAESDLARYSASQPDMVQLEAQKRQAASGIGGMLSSLGTAIARWFSPSRAPRPFETSNPTLI